MFLEALVRMILKRVAGVDADAWEKTLDLVIQAEHDGGTGAEKDARVSQTIRSTMSYLAPYAQKLLLGLAVAWARQRGLIAVKGNRPKGGIVLTEGEEQDDN